MRFGYYLALASGLLLLVYILGRVFAKGIMDQINHKLNSFTKIEEDDNKKETETK